MTTEEKYSDAKENLSFALFNTRLSLLSPPPAGTRRAINSEKNHRFVKQIVAELDAKTKSEYELANARIKREVERNLYLAAKEFVKAYEEYYNEGK